MTIITTIEFRAAAGQRDALVEKMLAILPDTRSYDGCESITFVESDESAGSFLLVERWASRDHYDKYRAWRKETGTSVLGSDLVDGTPTSQYFSLVNFD